MLKKYKKKLVLGTMKLNKYFDNSKDLSSFLIYAHSKGFENIHLSSEYESYPLVIKSLKRIKKKFNFVVKLAEPKNENTKFNLKRFEKKIFKYYKDLSIKNQLSIQFVNRYKCNNPQEYLNYQQKILQLIEGTINIIKKDKIINNFYFFPYHKEKNKINKLSYIDGICCYRNINQKEFDNYAKRNKFKVIAIRTFGGHNKIINKINLKKLILFNLKNSLVEKVIIGLNNEDQLNQLIKSC